MKNFNFLFFILFFSACSSPINSYTEIMSYPESSEVLLNPNFKNLTISGTSMEPLIKNGDDVLVDINFKEVLVTDIILYNYSGNKNLLIKKIFAVSGDKFEYLNNSIYINDEILKIQLVILI